MNPLLSRRQTLQSLATATVFASGAGGLILSLAGCGGSGGVGGGTQKGIRATSVKVKIVLPAGTSVSPAALRVATVAGSATPSPKGEVAVTILNDGPQYAEARDASGALVLAGFIGKDQTTLDAASTAQVLATFGLGAAAIVGPARPQVISSLRKADGFAGLVTEVEAALRVGGKVVFGAPALETKLDAMFAAAGGGTRSHVTTRGTIVEPTTNPSGIAVDTSVNGELKLKNVRLRRAIAWLDTISHQVDRGAGLTTVPAEKPSGPQDPIKIDPPKRFGGTIGTFKDVVENAVNPDAPLPYTPVDVGPLLIPAVLDSVPGCLSTEYKLSLVGPGASEGDLAKVGALREPQINRVFFDGFLLDYFLPFFTTVVIPLKGDEIDAFLKFSNGNAILGDVVNTVFSTAPAVKVLMAEGKYYDAVIALRDAGLLSGTFLPLMTDLFVAFVAQYGSEGLAANADKYLKSASGIFGTIGALDKGLSIAETFVVGADFLRSNRGDVLTIRSTGGKVTITAAKPNLPSNETTTLTAVIQDKNPNAVYKYEWRVSEGFRLNDSFGKNTDDSPGGVLVTSRESVAILAKDLQTGVATVRCKVSRIDGAKDVAIDDATTTVTFGGVIRLTPATASVKRGASTTLTASFESANELAFEYTVANPVYGTIDRSGRTAAKTVTFTAAARDGQTTVRVEVFQKIGGAFVSAGAATSTITVEQRQSYEVGKEFFTFLEQEPVTNVWYGYAEVIAMVPAVEGNHSYSLDGDNGDIAQDEDRLPQSWSTNNPPKVPAALAARFAKYGKPPGEYWFLLANRAARGSYPTSGDAQAAVNLILADLKSDWNPVVLTLTLD